MLTVLSRCYDDTCPLLALRSAGKGKLGVEGGVGGGGPAFT